MPALSKCGHTPAFILWQGKYLMNHPWISNATLRKAALIGLLAPVVIWANGATNEAAQATGKVAAPAGAPSNPRVYSVINLGPEAGMAALLNERGQAAFGSINSDGLRAGFFDGERIHALRTLGGSYFWIRSLNKYGVVVGESEDDAQPYSNILAISWTVGSGMRALAGSSLSSARDINDKGVIVGLASLPGVSASASRWEPDGSMLALGPLPFSLSEAFAINQYGMATGFTDAADGTIHASLWDRDGKLTDIGTLGGGRAFGEHINERTDVAGTADTASNDRVIGFFWNRLTGMVPIEGGESPMVSDLNDKGEVAGNTVIAGKTVTYLWSRNRGLTQLPMGDAVFSAVSDLNNHSEMVGAIERQGEAERLRAVRWPGLSAPIDLNTRLHRPPAGLVLQAGAAINDQGDILAHSNAGLVLLRPGERGTNTPVLGPIAGLPDAVDVGQQVDLTVGFVDNATGETHTAVAGWADNCSSPSPTVSEARGLGEVRLQHTFCTPGFYSVKVQVTDSGGRSTEVQRDIAVNASGRASISGRGTLARSPGAAGTGHKDLPMQFILWAALGGNPAATASQAGAGQPLVRLYGPFHFSSDQVSTASVDGQRVRVEGTGHLNGRPGYRFLIEAQDGDGRQSANPDRLRVRVTHGEARSGAEVVDYDNGAPAQATAARGAPGRDATAVAEGGLTLRN
jgi:uncharacterized membrane protein